MFPQLKDTGAEVEQKRSSAAMESEIGPLVITLSL